jgi:glutathione S-transferase
MIQIYGSPRSSAGRVYWMCEELNLPYKHVPMDMGKKEHKGDAFLKLNPNGKIPAIVDGDFVLWESMAITNYLAKKYDSPLAGKTLEEEAIMQQWSYWAILDLQKPAIDWLIQEVFVPADKKNPAVIENAKKIIPHYLQVLEKGLTGKEFLAASRFTVVNVLLGLKYDLSEYPLVTKWMGRCADRAAYQKLKAMLHG